MNLLCPFRHYVHFVTRHSIGTIGLATFYHHPLSKSMGVHADRRMEDIHVSDVVIHFHYYNSRTQKQKERVLVAFCSSLVL